MEKQSVSISRAITLRGTLLPVLVRNYRAEPDGGAVPMGRTEEREDNHN